jgi:hypothetical protein
LPGRLHQRGHLDASLADLVEQFLRSGQAFWLHDLIRSAYQFASPLSGALDPIKQSILERQAVQAARNRGGGSLFVTGASGALRGSSNFAPLRRPRRGCAISRRASPEFGPRGIQVSHIVAGGGIDGERLLSVRPDVKEKLGPDGLLNTDAIPEAYWTLHARHRSAWTLEVDLWPWSEKF